MVERIPFYASLRVRLLVGAGIIALVALFAAGLAAYGVGAAARMIERSANAQQRIDLLSALSARVSDYAVVTVETASATVPQDARTARLATASLRVHDAFEAAGAALERAVMEAERDGETEQMRRATRSLGLARMQAQFEALERSVAGSPPGEGLRAHLDGFATRFSPLLNEAVNDEIRDRDAARAAVADLRDRMVWQALAAGVGAAILTVIFYFALVRPIVDRLGQVRQAASRIGAGEFDISLAAGGRSELDALVAEIDRTAEQLRARQDAVDADRVQLNDIIGERTARLEEANTRLATIDTDRRRFFADIGHELRTPLTVILAESELGRGAGVDPDIAESLGVIHARAKRLNRRIDDLLRVARSDTGQIDLVSEPFDIAVPAAEAIADMEPLARRRGMTLASQLDPAPALGDADWTRQVVSGLIENAVKHSPGGGVIEVRCGAVDGRADLVVLDEGTGIAEDPATLFGRFARGGREASGSGFGVGLALARWVLERQSGSIRLESPAPRPPDGGTHGGPGVLVHLSMPLAATAPTVAEAMGVGDDR